MKRPELFAFKVNEYNYRRISFTRHYSRERAEAEHYTRFTQGEDPVSKDYSVTILEGEENFIKWALECNYRIDWENRVLIHRELKKPVKKRRNQ